MAALGRIEILSPGLLTTIQDAGRFGFGRYGVAPSGAVDAFSLRIANLLVGNPEDGACLETTLLGFRMRVLDDVLVALAGGDLQPEVDRQPLKMWSARLLKSGQTLWLRGPRCGCRAYLALGGGIDVPVVMGSRSTNLGSGFGGFKGRALAAGDILQVGRRGDPLDLAGGEFPRDWIPAYPQRWKLRVLWGPQDDEFPDESRHAFAGAVYTVTPESDRTGIRLQGPVVSKSAEVKESIISEGVVSGAVQVPGDGQPIIVLGETVTGGYRKIATVISADLPLLGQIKPGDEVRFQPVDMEEALALLRAREERIGKFRSRIRGPTENA